MKPDIYLPTFHLILASCSNEIYILCIVGPQIYNHVICGKNVSQLRDNLSTTGHMKAMQTAF